ncbi:MAG: mechanosensitive ion channel, partial [Desulfuromonadales bacterium]
MEVKIGVAYGSPTRDVARIIAKTLEEHGKILKDPEPVILFEDFGDSALVFSVFFWVEMGQKLDHRIIASDFRHMLDKRFREAGITIAFPQVDVHLDTLKAVEVRIGRSIEGSSPDKALTGKDENAAGTPQKIPPEDH